MNRLETDLIGKLQVIRINIHDPVGHELANSFDFRFTPTFIFFDANGIEQWRSVGALDVNQVHNSLTAQ
mgnify:CR=1